MSPRARTSSGFMRVPRRPSWAALLALPVAGAIAGAALGWAVPGDDGQRDGGSRVVTGAAIASGDVRLVLPDGWVRVRGRARLPGFDGRDVALLRGWNVYVALTQRPARHLSLLPAELVARTRAVPRPTTVTAGALRAQRYSGLRLQRGTSVDVYVAPTTRGTVTWACWGQASARLECDVVLPRLRLSRGRFLPVGPQAAFLQALPPVVQQLNVARRRERAALTRAATPNAGGRAAGRLAAAYETAAEDLRPLLAARSSAWRTVALLERLGRRHRRLAATLRSRSRTPYRSLARAIRGDEALLARTLERWQRRFGAPGGRA